MIYVFLYASLIAVYGQGPRFEIAAYLRPATTAIALSPDGKYMATAGWAGVRIYEFNNGNPVLLTTLKDHKNYVDAIAFSPDDRYLATGSVDNTVKIYRVSDGSFQLIKSLNDHSGGGLGSKFFIRWQIFGNRVLGLHSEDLSSQ